MAFYYRIFNYLIQSELECAHLEPVQADQTPDVVAHISQRPITIEDPKAKIIRVREVGEFYVPDGKHITAYFLPDLDPRLKSAYLVGLGMIIALYQRNFLVLHGNAIAINDKAAVIFMGPSGIGKSTLTEAFHRHGFHILTDDVCAIHLKESQPTIRPAYPYIKLWGESASAYDYNTSELKAMPIRDNKYYIPLNHALSQKELPLKAIYQLNTELPNKKLTGIEAYTQLNLNLSWPHLVGYLQKQQQVFEFCDQLYPKITMARILRPEMATLKDAKLFKHWLNTLTEKTAYDPIET